jgi:hypothetical protein
MTSPTTVDGTTHPSAATHGDRPTVLPAVRVLRPGTAAVPTGRHLQGMADHFQAAVSEAAAAAAEEIAGTMTTAADKLDRIADEYGERSMRALEARDYGAATVQANLADQHAQQARTLRRVRDGELS